MYLLLCFVGVSFLKLTESVGDTYNAGIVDSVIFNKVKDEIEVQKNINIYLHLIQDAGEHDVDILVFPSASLNHPVDAEKNRISDSAFFIPPSVTVPCATDRYPAEAISYISCAAKDARTYVAVNVAEKKYCDDTLEILDTTIVFDRNGKIVYRSSKPISDKNNCSITEHENVFETDFGVEFGIIKYSDLIIRNSEHLLKRGVKNFILVTSKNYASVIPINFPSFWAFVHKVNLLMSGSVTESTGLYSYSHNGVEVKSENGLFIRTIQKNPVLVEKHYNFSTLRPETTITEDLDLYSIKILDRKLTSRGVTETVCQKGFCCDFFVRISGYSNNELLLTVFNDMKIIDETAIDFQSCSIMYCSDIVDHKCNIRSSSTPDGVVFEEIKISANFTGNNSQAYPAIVTDLKPIDTNQFTFDTLIVQDTRYCSIKLTDSQNLLSFGLISTDYSENAKKGLHFDINKNDSLIVLDDYLFDKEQIYDFFDYLWIKIRIPLFIVSIYILEQI